MAGSTAKSTVDEIRERFDREVNRFSDLETGQSATIDAPLVMDLITETAAAVTPHATAVLDVGCGAGNYTLKLLQKLPSLDITLVDLSRPMLERAAARVSEMGGGTITAIQGDVRELTLPSGSFDIILAAAVLHHLREEQEWVAVFDKFFSWLRPGGSLWISDLVSHQMPQVQQVLWHRYGKYLTELGGGGVAGDDYRDKVFAYIEHEDSPRPLEFQLDILRQCGFLKVDVLHKNGCFAAYGALKGRLV